MAHRGRELSLRDRERGRIGRGEEAFGANRLRLDEEAGERGKAAPREREPPVRVEAAAEELEVVREDQEAAGGDEREQPPAPGRRRVHADRERAAERGSG